MSVRLALYSHIDRDQRMPIAEAPTPRTRVQKKKRKE